MRLLISISIEINVNTIHVIEINVNTNHVIEINVFTIGIIVNNIAYSYYILKDRNKLKH